MNRFIYRFAKWARFLKMIVFGIHFCSGIILIGTIFSFPLGEGYQKYQKLKKKETAIDGEFLVYMCSRILLSSFRDFVQFLYWIYLFSFTSSQSSLYLNPISFFIIFSMCFFLSSLILIFFFLLLQPSLNNVQLICSKILPLLFKTALFKVLL